MDKKQELLQIKLDMEADKYLPLISKPQYIIPGYWNSDAEIVFIGEAGGYNESVQRKPFVGQAGKLLDKLLELSDIKREDVYITNMVKTRPPNNRDPLPDELKSYENYLDRELKVIKPKVIITLGRFSMAKFLPNVFISGVHGKKYEVLFDNRKIIVVPMYHPAASLRNGSILEQEKKDFINLKTILTETLSQEGDKIDPVQLELI